MNLEDWTASALTLAAAHTELSEISEPVVRDALVDTHQLMRNAPNSIIDSYRRINEIDLITATEKKVDEISKGDFNWLRIDTTDQHDWSWTLGVQIRAFDSALLTLARTHYGPPGDPNVSYSSTAGALVIPRKHLSVPSAANRNGQSFSRRGLLYHRILPKEINGYKVSLVWHDTILPAFSRKAEVITMGAALFADLSIKTAHDTINGFVVTDVDCRDPEGTVTQQVTASIVDGCFGVSWPELTVPPRLRQHIVTLLKERALDSDPRPAPQVLIAGTWHEEQDGRTINLATVLNGYGETKLVFQKLIPFIDRELGPERIVRGEKLPILVTDEYLIAFAICRDYCDLSLKLPYPELDVDLVFVPSMGDENTMAGHQVTAKLIRVLYGARTFVVQQAIPSIATELGLVLPFPNDPLANKPAKLRQFKIWASYQGGLNGALD